MSGMLHISQGKKEDFAKQNTLFRLCRLSLNDIRSMEINLLSDERKQLRFCVLCECTGRITVLNRLVGISTAPYGEYVKSMKKRYNHSDEYDLHTSRTLAGRLSTNCTVRRPFFMSNKELRKLYLF